MKAGCVHHKDRPLDSEQLREIRIYFSTWFHGEEDMVAEALAWVKKLVASHHSHHSENTEN